MNIGNSASQCQSSNEAGRPSAGADAVRLRVDDGRQVERTDQQQHGDDHEADGDFVGDHLRRRAQRAEERILRVRRPAAHDDAVDAERRDREDVEDADVEVGDHPLAPAIADSGITAQAASAVTVVTIGASRKIALSAPAGMIGSLKTNLSRSANDCSSPKAPTTLGPRRICTAAQTLRSISSRIGDDEQQRDISTTLWTTRSAPRPTSAARRYCSRSQPFDRVTLISPCAVASA